MRTLMLGPRSNMIGCRCLLSKHALSPLDLSQLLAQLSYFGLQRIELALSERDASS